MIDNVDIKFGTLAPIVVNHPVEGMMQFRCYGKFSYKGVAGVPEELVRMHVVEVISTFVSTHIVNYSVASFPSILVNSIPNIIIAINSRIKDLGAELTGLNIEALNKV